MKHFLKWLGKVVGTALCLCLCIILLPYAYRALSRWLPDGSRNAVTVSAVLSRYMEESSRLETSRVRDEGVVSSSIDALWIGQVQNVVMEYTYEASLGIDLKKVHMAISGNTVTLTVPDMEILQDSITITKVDKDDFWYPLSEERRLKLIDEEKLKCRNHYLEENDDVLKANDNTVRVLSELVDRVLSEAGRMNVEIVCVRETSEE